MDKNITAGIDIGTYHVKVVIARKPDPSERNIPMILGRGMSESKGLRYGYIVNQDDAVRSITSAIRQAEEDAGVSVKRAFVSIGGIELAGFTTHASVVISRADSQITSLDIEKVHEASENEIPPQDYQNRKIIHSVPIAYRVDGRTVFGDPSKMKGVKLEAKMLFITCLDQHLTDLINAVESANVEVTDVTPAPLAAGCVILSKQQRTAGCVLANIGAETVSIAVYENNIPISLEIFPIGSTDITNDIALGLKVPLEEAEQIKHGKVGGAYPKKKLDEIIKARLSDMFDLIEAHLKKIGRSGLLPAGIIITGGGSGIGTVEDLARSALDLPSKVATLGAPERKSRHGNTIKDSTWSVAYGLCVIGFHNERTSPIVVKRWFFTIKNTLQDWLKKFLP